MRAKAVHICGTGSGVGKSVIVTALCRIFLQDGFSTAPFKAQNMALNSFVTKDGREIGRAQAAQAQACKIEPSADMNPILIKPTTDTGAQIILRGKPIGNMSAIDYVSYKKKAWKTVLNSFRYLSGVYELIVIEGAGSPAEVNLKSHDIVNMKMAQAAGAPVVLVGDIDKGGVFAWVVGTLELLTKEERKRIKGIIINKFRGDKRLLAGGIKFLEKKTGIRVLGIIPFFKDIRIQEEDSVSLDQMKSTNSNGRSMLKVDVVYLPHISNFTDFDALKLEGDVRLNYVRYPEDLDGSDIIVIPGSKNTISDLSYLKRSGIANKILTLMRQDTPCVLIGICGGFQMLGEEVLDIKWVESSSGKVEGLGLLPLKTTFSARKKLSQVEAKDIRTGLYVFGYEIHHGKTEQKSSCKAVFKILKRGNKLINETDGAQRADGRIWGTYIHGIFDSDEFRRDFLNRIRAKKGWEPIASKVQFDNDREFDKLARIVRGNIDMDYLYRNILKIKKV